MKEVTRKQSIAQSAGLKQSRRGAIEPFLVVEAYREACELARQGKDIIHLSLGQPGREAPPRVLRKVAELLTAAPLGYTEAGGLLPLRRRIAKHYGERYGLDIPWERIYVTLGSSSAFMLALLAAFDPGDRVAVATPYYPAYPAMLGVLGLEKILLRGSEESRFQPTLSMLQALPCRPEGLVIGSPSNPAGTVIAPSEMESLAEYCAAQGIRILSDEIYHGVTYGAPAASVLAYTDQAIVINSFSKYFLLPGWRLGWAVVPPDLARAFESLSQNFFISPSAIAQYAALETFECVPELDQVVKDYHRNRGIMLEALPALGITRFAPADGAFYLYADVSHLTPDSREFCRAMLHEARVSTVSGCDFDPERGHEYVRFSFSGEEERLQEALRRIKAWLG